MKPRVLDRYSVYFFPQALEVLGDDAKMFLNGEGERAHVICREIDTAGSLLEMTLDCQGPDGEAIEVELMVPSNMVRLIISTRGDGSFGFRPRTGGEPATAGTIPGRVPERAPAAAVEAPAAGTEAQGAATSTQTR